MHKITGNTLDVYNVFQALCSRIVSGRAPKGRRFVSQAVMAEDFRGNCSVPYLLIYDIVSGLTLAVSFIVDIIVYCRRHPEVTALTPGEMLSFSWKKIFKVMRRLMLSYQVITIRMHSLPANGMLSLNFVLTKTRREIVD